MKLVRARPKAPEHLPDWLKCCPEQVQFQQDIGEIVLDLDVQCVVGPGSCLFCNASSPGDLGARIVSGEHAGRPFALSAADLDETGVPDGNYVETVAR
jgi:hypothetical protein